MIVRHKVTVVDEIDRHGVVIVTTFGDELGPSRFVPQVDWVDVVAPALRKAGATQVSVDHATGDSVWVED